ncbi:MAG: hypothetical protein U0641_19725 [Anaerolineae bacterium]
MATVNDIVLAEGERREDVPLMPDEVAALRACDLLDVAPGWATGTYSLTTRSLVGHAALPARRVVVQPKVPLRNVFAMLTQVTGQVKTAPDVTALDAGEPILAGIADLYARTLDELLAHGGVRAWTDVTDESPFVRGRLLLGATLRQPPTRRHLPVMRRSEWSANTLVNQLLKQAARALLGLDLPADTRPRLARAMSTLADVADTDHGPDTFDSVPLTRQNAEARPALLLARWVSLGCAPSLAPGPHPFPAFRLDMARLFEEFVAAVLKETLATAGLSVAVQPLLPLDEAGEVPLRPDVVVYDRRAPRLALDTKYKLPGPPRPDDLYQILAYCHALGAPVGGLVFPAATTAPPLVVRHTGVTVYALGVDLGAPPDRFPLACAALTEAVRTLLSV